MAPNPWVICEGVPRAAVSLPRHAPLLDQTPAGRIYPLLIGTVAKKLSGEFGLGQSGSGKNEQFDIIGERHAPL